MKKSILLFIFIFNLLLNTFSANSPATLLEQGNKQYQEGQFFEAIHSYKNILNDGFENFELYYNLGNSYFKINQIPEAIYYYEKALQLQPRDEDTRFNLSFVNSLINTDMKTAPEAFHIQIVDSVMRWFTPDGWAISGIILLILTLTLVILFLIQTSYRLKKLLFFLSFAGLLLTASSWYFGNRLYQSITDPNHAIIMVSSVGIKSSPDIKSADVYVAQAGTKVKILSKLGDWYEIRVPDGNKGWINVESVLLI